jgi:hypothetical protein
LEERATLLLEHLPEQGTLLEACCHLLAGQLYAQRTFADLNSGEWHRQQAEAWLLHWLAATSQSGLPAGESEQSFVDALLALSHLVDLAHSDEIAELAAAVLDKLAFQLALHSFVGAWGGSQDDPTPQWLPSTRLGPLSGVARLWWGQGCFNAECAATVALACAENYTLPEILAAVGLDRRQENWLQRQDARANLGTPETHTRVNRAAYRTGDYLLASAQGDWPAGKGGLLWRATLGPDAVIFGNRPAWSSSHAAWQNNYWCGSAARVRVAQWHEVLVVAYGAAENARLAFSHAYFPKAIYDDVRMAEGWVMAAKGNGYVAMTATGGLTLVSKGRSAQREVRAAAESIWLVHMGSAGQDGTFADFAEKVLALPVAFEEGSLQLTSLRGQTLRFSSVAALDQALWVDGVAQPLDEFPHLASIYGGASSLPATSLDIHYQEHQMRLDFSAPTLSSAPERR